MYGKYVIDALVLTLYARRDQVLHAHNTLAQLTRIVLHVAVHLVCLEDERHLLLREWLACEIFHKLAQMGKTDLVVHIDDLAREKVPFLWLQIIRDLLEQVN